MKTKNSLNHVAITNDRGAKRCIVNEKIEIIDLLWGTMSNLISGYFLIAAKTIKSTSK